MSITPIAATATQALTKRSLPTLLGHMRNTIADGFVNGASDLNTLRRNAMMLSGAIQISSRILVANATAAKTRGTPEGYYRFQEAANTTFREIFAWCATYLLLNYAMRFIADFFRAMLWVRSGVAQRPTMFLPLLNKIFSVPDNIRRDVMRKATQSGPGMLSALGGHIKDFANGVQKPLSKFPRLPALVEKKADFLDVDLLRRRAQYRTIEPLVNAICRLSGKPYQGMIPAEKIKVFFNWAPPVLGSIPAIIISGYGSESLTQRYARRFANKVSQVAGGKQPQGGMAKPGPSLPGLEEENAVLSEPTVAYSAPSVYGSPFSAPAANALASTQYAAPYSAAYSAMPYPGWVNPYAAATAYPYGASPWMAR